VRKWSKAAQIVLGLVFVTLPVSNFKPGSCPRLPAKVRRCQELKYERERQRREECGRAISVAYQKALDVIRQYADVVTGFGVAGLSALGIAGLMRKSKVT
jgi:hypothetical protein